MFKVYHATYNPHNLTGQVGGAITTTPYSGYLDELFYNVSAPPSGTDSVYQYRKLYIKNEFLVASNSTRVWVDAVDHPEQITIALATGSHNIVATNPITEPTGISDWVESTNYTDGIELGTLSVNSYTGVWVRQKLENIVEEDPFATFRLYVGGIVE